jgi:hypothetical protein
VASDLRRIYGVCLHQSLPPNAPHFTDEDIERWTALSGGTRTNLCEQIAIYLAKQFHAGEVTYAFCDAIVNDLFGVLITSPPADWSELFYRIYCAFDEGEYQHKDRPVDEDPVEMYTRRYIAEILAYLPSSN